jgi:hypothetical protein
MAAGWALAAPCSPPYEASATCATPSTAFGRSLELTASHFVESWNFNGSREVLSGGAAAVPFIERRRWSALVEVRFMRVGQRSKDAYVGGVSALARRIVRQRGRKTVFIEGGLGASYGTVPVPDRGTRFNYLVQAGVGGMFSVSPRVDLVADVRVLHLSNLSLAGRNRNPDIQALGGQLGVVMRFR